MTKLEVICGPMFAGKTEELIRRVKRACIAKQTILVFKPAMDNRYGADKIVSHGQTDLELATGVRPVPITEKDIDLPPESKNADLVAFDEAQFFDPFWLGQQIDTLIDNGVRVICAGLDLDSFGNPFGSMPMLLSRADEVTKLKAICVVCSSDANRTFRKVKSNETMLVGGLESYEPRCFDCWAYKR